MSADEHEGMQFVEGHGWLPVVTLTPTEQGEVTVYDRPNPYLIEVGGDSTSPWSAWDEGWDAHAKSITPRQPAKVLLYGLPGDENLSWEPSDVYESEGWMGDTREWEHQEAETPHGYMEPIPPPGFSFVIEEFTTRPPLEHLPSVDWVVDNVLEWTGDNGELGEDQFERWERAAAKPEVLAAFQRALEMLAAEVGPCMANDKVRDLVVTFDDKGEPLLDGEPMYVKRLPGDRSMHQADD